MIFNKINLLAYKFCSKASIKPEMKAVAFYGDKTVATDSFRLIEITVPGGEKLAEPILIDKDTVKPFTSAPKVFLEVNPKLEKVVGKFPNYTEILDQATSRQDDIVFSVNGEYLEQACSILKQMSKFKEVVLHIPREPNKAIILKAKSSTSPQEATVLLMPMNRTKPE